MLDENWRLAPVSILNIFQDIATDASAAVYPTDDLKADGYAWLVISTRFQVTRYPQIGEKLTVATFPKSFRKIFAERGYEIYDAGGEVIIRGSSLWLLYDVKNEKAAMIGNDISGRYVIEDREMLPVIRRDIQMPDMAQKLKEYTVQKRDIDSNHHVNNAKYIEFALEMLDGEREIKELEIFYRHAAVEGDNLLVYTASRDDDVFCEIKKENGDVCVTIKAEMKK